jgi:integrase/recombinase XerD
MALGKQAKTLSKGQIQAVLGYLAMTRHPTRNRLIFLLSVKAGLRAKEIARLTWWMTNDPQGKIGRAICLQDSASKGKSGRMIPLRHRGRSYNSFDKVCHLPPTNGPARKMVLTRYILKNNPAVMA